MDPASTIEEGYEMTEWPSRDTGSPVYRLALLSAGISLSEGFITQHPRLPKSVQKLMEPIACIPSSVKEMFPIECSKVSDKYFYDEIPPYLEKSQVAAIDHLFFERIEEMFLDSTPGTTDANWAECTKTKLFLPLFDPSGNMKKLTNEDSLLSYPSSVCQFSGDLRSPNPDIVFGSRLNRALLVDELKDNIKISNFSLDHRRLDEMLNMTELLEVACGVTDDLFCFPTFVVERKSDNGSLYAVENQLSGAFRCIFEAQKVAQSRVNEDLPILPLGITNVGNWIYLSAGWPNSTREDLVMNAAHITDYHLFRVENCIEFASLTVRVVMWMREYQEKLFTGIHKNPATPKMVSTVPAKRDHETDEDDDDVEGESRPKRANTKNIGIS